MKRGPLRLTVANVHAVEDVSLQLNVGENAWRWSANPAAASPPRAARSYGSVEPMSGAVTLDGWDGPRTRRR